MISTSEYFFNNYYTFTDLIPTDIYPVQYGEQQCRPGYGFGPCIRTNHLVHYVYSGCGTLCMGNQEYPLHAGQLFLIPAKLSAYYKADSEMPWLYRWVEFNGSLAQTFLERAELSADNPILIDSADHIIGNALLAMTSRGELPFEELMGYFWGFLSALTGQFPSLRMESTAEGYIKQAETFIRNNLHQKISVSTVAEYIGIDRSYLCRLFQEYKHTSPKQYMDTLKMNRAVQYLRLPNTSVTEVAYSLGYYDCHAFNKAFQKTYGCSPSVWRAKPEYEQNVQGPFPENDNSL